MRKDEKEILGAYTEEGVIDYMSNRKRGTMYNDYLSNPALRELVGDVKGKRVLDIGSGYGADLEYFAARGAKLTGIELNENFIKILRSNPKLQDADIRKGTIYDLKGLRNFDIAYANQVLDQVEDLQKALKNVSQTLKKNGIFVFSIAHPLRTLTGEKGGNTISGYFNQKKIHFNPVGTNIKIPAYYRNLEVYSKAISEAGFIIEEIREPQPQKSTKKLFPKLYKQHSNFPEVLVMRLRKF